MSLRHLSAVVVSVGALGFAGHVNGDVLAQFIAESTFTSQTDAAAEAPIPNTGSVPSPSTLGDLTYAFGPGATSMFFGTGDATQWTTRNAGNDIALSGTENLDVDLAAPVFSFGFEFVEPQFDPNTSGFVDSTFEVTLISGGAGGSVIGTLSFNAPNDQLYFFGATSSAAFDRVEIREVSGGADNEYYGQFFSGNQAGRFWATDGNGTWDSGGHWTGGTTPGSTDDVFITPDVAATVTGPAAATTVGSLTLDNLDSSTTTLNLAAGPLTVSNDLVVSQVGDSRLNVGTGTLNVGGETTIATGGTLQVDSGGAFNPTGAVNLAGGTLSVDSLGALSPNWTAGTLAVTGAAGLAVNLNGVLGPNPVSIDDAKTLEVTDTLIINSAAIFQADGGVVNAGNLTAFLGTINANSGQINVAGTLTNQGTTNLNGATVTATDVDASAVAINHNDGELIVDGGTYTPFAGANDFTLSGEPGSPVLTLDNGATLNVAGALNLAPGADEDGTLNILGGSAVTAAAVNAGSISFFSDAIINVDGAGSTLDIAGNLDLGRGNDVSQAAQDRRDQLNVSGGTVTIGGTAILNTTSGVTLSGGQITAGGWVRNAASNFDHTGGTLTIDGGDFSSGTSGFNFTGADRPVIELINGATHNGVNIDMRNAEWHALSGSTITATTLELFNSTGTGDPTEMVIDASTLTLTGELNVGTNGGDGELTVRNGSTASSSALRIGFSGSGATGTVTIDGPGTTFTAGTLFTGNGTNNNGDLIISDGALLTITGAANGNTTVGDDGTGLATITVTGDNGGPSTLDAAGFMWIGGSDNENGGDATIDIEEGGLMNSDGAIVGFGNGGGSDGTGVVNITGPESFWNAIANGTNDLFIGDNGNGTLNVTAGGRVDADALVIGDEAGSETALVTIDGDDSIINVSGLIHIGSGRKGTLNLTDGAALNTGINNSSAEARIGNAAGADGSSVLVDNATWTHQATGKFAVGDDSDSSADGPASLTIRNGGSVSTGGLFFVADQPGSTGSVIVDGEGSLLDIGDDVRLGDNGAGTMEIRNGGDVTTAPTAFFEVSAFGGGSGDLTVTNPGSTLTVGGYLSVGDEGAADGTLLIDDGGVVATEDDHVYIARASSSSTGVITVQDLNTGDGSAGAQLNSGASLFIGGNATVPGGNGTLNVNAGGAVNVTGQLKLYSRATVNLQGGEINVGSFDIVPPVEIDSGTFNFLSGTFRFNADATLSSERLSELFTTAPGVVPTLNADQHLVVTNEAALTAPLRLNGGTLAVGSIFADDLSNLDFDAGTLEITDVAVTVGVGGLAGDNITLGPDQHVIIHQGVTVDPGGALSAIEAGFEAGSLVNDGLVSLSHTTVDFDRDDSGTGLTNHADLLLVETTVNGPVDHGVGSTVTVVGEAVFNDPVSGSADYFGPGTVTFNGGNDPGNSTDQISFEGGVAFGPGNTLFIELGGLTPGTEHDQLDVAGSAAIDGSLKLSLIDELVLAFNQTFDILNHADRSGTFSTIDGVRQADKSLAVTYEPNAVRVTVALPADANLDEAVDVIDLGRLGLNFGVGDGVWSDGDFNGDGLVDVIDLGTLGLNFGQSLPTGDIAVAVPEPGGLGLLLLGGLAIVRRRASRSI